LKDKIHASDKLRNRGGRPYSSPLSEIYMTSRGRWQQQQQVDKLRGFGLSWSILRVSTEPGDRRKFIFYTFDKTDGAYSPFFLGLSFKIFFFFHCSIVIYHARRLKSSNSLQM